jgi:amidohydrolase
MLRFDMDALPIREETGAEYTSQTEGVMHACGHDGHSAIGLTVARLLQYHRKDFSGAVKLVFQPAEEGMGGAEAMIRDGALTNPRPDMALGLHLWNDQPVGWLGIADGPVMAAAEKFTVAIHGKGGHGAVPHLAVDPVLAAAQIIVALQSIVSRTVAPLDSGVVSVTTLDGGEAFNVIPPSVKITGTIRTFEAATRQKVLERFEQITRGVAEAMGCRADVEIESLTPAVVNHPAVSDLVRVAAARVLAPDTLQTRYATMGSEDMAFFLQEVPGCYFFVGSANAEKGLNFAHHHPRFDIDEAVLPRAVTWMTAAALDALQTP